MGNKVVVKGGTTKELTANDLQILRSNSKLSEQEIKDLHTAFWTDFPTGRMDKKGFVRYYEEIKDQKDKSSVLCDHVFAIFDKNHDGTIDFHEFLLAVAAGSPGDLDSHLNYVFEMCDVSGDGLMDIHELSVFLRASLTIAGKFQNAKEDYPRQLALNVFQTLGINQTAKINREQFIRGCKNDSSLRDLFGGGH